MEEVEDTPIFQERVTYLEGQSKAIKAEVKLLIGQAHAFAHAGVQYAEAGKAFAAKADELGAVMPALQSVGAGLKELFKLVEIMSQKQNELTQPLEQLCAQIKQAKQMRSDMDKAAEDFYSCLTKSLALRSDAEPALQLETDRECMRRRGRFDLLRLEYLARLSDISARKHQHVISFFGSVVATVVEALQSGLQALGDVSPVVGDVSRAADEQQSELERQQMMRLQLITSHIEEHEALLPAQMPSTRPGGGGDGKSVRDQIIGSAGPHEKLQYVCEMRGWLGKSKAHQRGHMHAPRGGRHDHRQARYWSVLSDGKLFLYKNWRDPPKHVFDLLLCTVREARNVPERFCFEIISPSNAVVLQAETQSAMVAWTKVIQNATGKALDQQQPRAAAASADQARDGLQSGSNHAQKCQALRLLAGNDLCADCGARSPEWASVSLGVLICLQCSGHHRRLGVHVSRVRSLQLDIWEEATMELMMSLGNAKVNALFLATASGGVDSTHFSQAQNERLQSLDSADNGGEEDLERVRSVESVMVGRGAAGGGARGFSADDQELLIRRKYQERAFLAGWDKTAAEASQALFEAIGSGDILGMLQAIANGTDVNRHDTDELSSTALMQAVKTGNLAAVELLLHHRADHSARDARGRSCLHHAAMLDYARCAEVLLVHSASADALDDMGETALQVAAQAPRADVFEAIVRSKGLRVGKQAGFGSGSDPEDNTHSPRSASPPMAKGPSSPELSGHHGLRLDEAAALNRRGSQVPPALTSSRSMREQTAKGHRRGLSWSGWTSARKSASAVATAIDAATHQVTSAMGAHRASVLPAPPASPPTQGRCVEGFPSPPRVRDSGFGKAHNSLSEGGLTASVVFGDADNEASGAGVDPSQAGGRVPVAAGSKTKGSKAKSGRLDTLMRGLEHLKGLQPSSKQGGSGPGGVAGT